MRRSSAARYVPALVLAGLVILLLAFAGTSEARPGGGHSYSGGGSSSGGGYSSGGGSYSGGGGSYSGGGGSFAGGGGPLFWICLLGFFILMVHDRTIKTPPLEWASAPSLPAPAPELAALRRFDPEFSSVYFEDFMYHLYAEAHRARSDAESMALLRPQLGEKTRRQLLGRVPTQEPVDRIVIGSMTVVGLQMPDRATTDDGRPYFVNIALRFESNMVVGSESSAAKYYVDETWNVSRAANIVTGPALRMKASLCSNCGAPYVDSTERVCQSCDQVVGDGRFGWRVNSTHVHKLQKQPDSLTGHAEERGTYARSIVHPRMLQELSGLQTDDPACTTEHFLKRCRLIFSELYRAWNDDDLARVRPYVSDSLFNYLRYWLDAYRHAGLENWVDDYEVGNCEIVKVVRDRHYDAITVRLWASGKDYTVDAKQRVVGGSAKELRQYSEYWTMIRRADARGAPAMDKNCPGCGADLKISMAGICEFCAAHVTAGEFDWVLSKIEQDESYHG